MPSALRRLSASTSVASALTLVLVALAARHAARATALLDWPHDPDLYRDITYAQAVLDGEWRSDPFYLDETLWYNPLVPSLVAGVSSVSGVPVHQLYARAGAYFNLLAPLAFALMVGVFLGPWPALAATFAFVFLQPPGVPPWASATYSPWLFPSLFVQGIFYAGLIAVDWAGRSGERAWYAVLGVVLGVTFLGHTAPALLLASTLVLEAGRRLVRPGPLEPRSARALVGLALALSVAAFVSLPLTFSIVGRYRLHVLNTAPAAWFYDVLALDRLGSLLLSSVTPVGLLAVVGAIAVFRDRGVRDRARPLVSWALANFVWLLWVYGAQLGRRLGYDVRGPVPDYHFLFYWRALAAVLAGYGAVSAAFALAAWLARIRVGSARTGCVTPVLGGVIVVLATFASLAVVFPAFSSRSDFTEARLQAWRMGHRQAELLAWEWIRTHTPPHAVFLAGDDMGLFVIGPAGRKVVALDAFFSNPYVERRPRVEARERMLAGIAAADGPAFCEPARRYQVTYAVLDEDRSQLLEKRGSRVLEPAFGVADIRIWRVVGCEPGVR